MATKIMVDDPEITIKTIDEKDLPEVLRIYAQTDMDNGQVLALADATAIYNRMKSYL